MVTKYSDGYYLEGQDYWRLAGIFDDVSIYATPDVRLFDWYVVTDLDETYTDADAFCSSQMLKSISASPAASYTLKATYMMPTINLVAEMTSDKFSMENSVGKNS